MNAVVPDVSSPALGAAMDANLAGENSVFGRELPGAEYHEEPDVIWWLGGVPTEGQNGIACARFKGDAVDARIDATLAPFKERHAALIWTVGPSSRPADLGEHLIAHGLHLVHQGRGMAADLHALHEVAPPPGFMVEEMTDPERLNIWRQAQNAGFGAADGGPYDVAYLRMGCDPALPWWHYVGWLRGEPVATASLLMAAGVAGIYGVTTIPAARRQGIGAAMTLAPLRAARARGYHVGILYPSAMATGVYRRLGFREVCTMRYYCWSP